MAETAPATSPSPEAPPPSPVAPFSAPPAPAPDSIPSTQVVHIRGLFINLIFAMFAATVIFAVASYFFLVPRIVIQELHVARLHQDVRALQAKLRAESAPPAAALAAPAAEPAAPAAPAAPVEPTAAAAAAPAPAK